MVFFSLTDPFLLRHNLGAGIHKNMFHFIKQCFINARSHFGNCKRWPEPTSTNPEFQLKWYQQYFFDGRLLSKGRTVPQDR